MKICFINNRFGKIIRGGAERTIKNLADYLKGEGHEVTIIEATVVYNRLANWSKSRRFLYHATSFLNFASYRRLQQKIKQGKFDLIWAHNLTGFGLLALRALGKGKKVFTMHDIQLLHPSGLLMYGQENKLNTFIAKIYQGITKFLFPKDALVVFPSQWLESLYRRYGFFKHNKTLLLNNSLAKTLPETKKDGAFTFLYLGQIEEHKGIRLLLKTFSSFEANVRLIIAGDGSLLAEFKKNNQDQRIVFIGGYTEPRDYLRQADCLVIPSICYENLPTVALEAAQMEISVIGSNLGGIGETIGAAELLFKPTEQDLERLLHWAINNQSELKSLAASGRTRLKLPTLEEYWQKVKSQI